VKLEVSRNTLMMSAAVVSNLRVSVIRPRSWSSVSAESPRTWGITATPVSNPESPSARRGKTSSATATMATGLPCAAVMALPQSITTEPSASTRASATTVSTRFKPRYTPTNPTAIPMASVNPRRNTAASSASRARVTNTASPCSSCGAKGFSMMCAVASAAERVIVMRKSVAAKPSRANTNSLPAHQGRRCSSIAMEPSPCGLSLATVR